MKTETEITDLDQIPAIMREDGTILPLPPETRFLDENQIKKLSGIFRGDLVWIKYRVHFAPLETKSCVRRDCYNPPEKESHYCTGHKK